MLRTRGGKRRVTVKTKRCFSDNDNQNSPEIQLSDMKIVMNLCSCLNRWKILLKLEKQVSGNRLLMSYFVHLDTYIAIKTI
jgi:hypothetical protein